MRSAVLALPKASSRRVVSSSASSRACLLAHAVIFAIPHDIVFLIPDKKNAVNIFVIYYIWAGLQKKKVAYLI